VNPTRSVEAVVIGAGYAGLTAALRLHQAGVEIAVVEARDRVGGRACTEVAADGILVDHGGQWIGPTQARLRGLADEMGVETFKVYSEGKNIEFREGGVGYYTGPLSSSDPIAAADVIEAILKIEMMSLGVPLEAPWEAEKAVEWDSQTFQTWIDHNARSPRVAEAMTLFVQAVLCAEPRDISLLHVLFYVHSAGGVYSLVGVSGNAQDSRFRGGAQETANRVAAVLGDRVILGAPVRRLDHGQSGVRVTHDGGDLRAERAVVALPPTLAGRLRYQPALPGYRDQLTQRVPMATTIKVHCIYNEPFWRADGLSGQVTSSGGMVQFTFDNSPETGSPGVLVAFIEADQGRVWGRATAADRRAAVLSCLARYFGPRAAEPLQYLERAWHDEEYTRGCYGGLMPPGAWTSYGRALRESIGPIHWAGTETATVWSGYMDGAVSSGERAAAEVLAAQGHARRPTVGAIRA
jgi:monoamine oxidase